MIECAIAVVLWAIVIAVCLWAFEAVATAFGLQIPPPVQTLIRVLAVLLLVLLIVQCIAGGAPLRIGAD